MKMYKLGQSLRKKYDNFLGDYYFSKNIHSRCSSYARTKISLMLVMAGLFPSTDKQIWSNNLIWQPIMFDYKLKMHDLVNLHSKLCIVVVISILGILWHCLSKLLQTL